jgi:hypothetical protein
MTVTKAYRVKGTTDDVTTCDQCGLEDLKSTVVMAALDPEGNEDGFTYMGRDCAAKATGWTQSEVRKLAATADREAKRQAEIERRVQENAEHAVFMAGYLTWLETTHGTRNEDAVVLDLRRNQGNSTASPFQLRKAYRQTLAD